MDVIDAKSVPKSRTGFISQAQATAGGVDSKL